MDERLNRIEISGVGSSLLAKKKELTPLILAKKKELTPLISRWRSGLVGCRRVSVGNKPAIPQKTWTIPAAPTQYHGNLIP
jgi:hypothetical protein